MAQLVNHWSEYVNVTGEDGQVADSVTLAQRLDVLKDRGQAANKEVR